MLHLTNSFLCHNFENPGVNYAFLLESDLNSPIPEAVAFGRIKPIITRISQQAPTQNRSSVKQVAFVVADNDDR